MSKYIKSGDTVKLIAGNSKGKTGKVIMFNRKTNKLKVEQVNIQTHFNKNDKQGITKREGWIDASNVMLMEDDKVVKVYKKDNKRLSKKTNKEI